MSTKEDNDMKWSKDSKYVLEKVGQIERIWNNLSKRVKTTTFVTVMALTITVMLTIGGGLLSKVFELSNTVARIEGMLAKVLTP